MLCWFGWHRYTGHGRAEEDMGALFRVHTCRCGHERWTFVTNLFDHPEGHPLNLYTVTSTPLNLPNDN